MDELRKTYRTAVIIGLAMMASVVIYAGIVEMARQGSIPVRGPAALGVEQLRTVKLVLFGLSAVIFFMIRVVQERILESISSSGPQLKTSDSGRDIQRLLTSAIVAYAMSETPAIFGLVVFFLGRDAMDFYLFMLISFAFFSRSFPKYAQWEERLRGGRSVRSKNMK